MDLDDTLIDELMNRVDDRFLIDRLKEMVAIKSENPFDQEPVEGFREKEMAEYYAQQMHQLGMEVSSREVRPGGPNVLSWTKNINCWGLRMSVKTVPEPIRALSASPPDFRFARPIREG